VLEKKYSLGTGAEFISTYEFTPEDSAASTFTTLSAPKSPAPTFMLLHGLNGAASQWQGVAETLAADYRVITVDLPCHGNSSMEGAFEFETQVIDVVKLIEEIGSPVHLVGASFGGVLALAVAAAHPNVVSTVSTIGTALRPPDLDIDKVIELLKKMGALKFFELSATKYSFGPAPSQKMLAEAITVSTGRDIEVISRVLRSGLSVSPLPYVDKIQCPALVCVGEHDNTCPPDKVVQLSESLNTKLELIKGGGHLVHIEEPTLVAAILSLHARSSRARSLHKKNAEGEI